LATLYLVRHAEAAVHWTEAEDAELSELGTQQAAAVARALAPRGPVGIFSSPLKRARQTAAPLESLWKTPARIEAAIAEIPTQGVALAERSAWLSGLMEAGWRGADEASRQWRQGVLDFVTGRDSNAVIFTHFVVINAVIGAALDRDEVYVCKPANASITVMETEGRTLRLIEQSAL
jgi:broad specificity phosphatase PhoE